MTLLLQKTGGQKKKSYLGWGLFHGKERRAVETCPGGIVEHQVNPCCTAVHRSLSVMPTGCMWGCCRFVDADSQTLNYPSYPSAMYMKLPSECNDNNFIRSLYVILYKIKNVNSNNKISFKALFTLPGNLSLCPRPFLHAPNPISTHSRSINLQVLQPSRTVL